MSFNSSANFPFGVTNYNENHPAPSLHGTQTIDFTTDLGTNVYTGMEYLETFLAKYRLKRYAAIFKNYTVNNFLALNEEELSILKIPLGSRTKLLKCIQKLNSRCYDLRKLAILIENNRDKVVSVLDQLLEMIMSPIQAHWSSLYEVTDHIHGINALNIINNISSNNLPGMILIVTCKCHEIVVQCNYPLNLTVFDRLFGLYFFMYNRFAFTYTQKVFLYRQMSIIKIKRDWAESYIATQAGDPYGLVTEEKILDNIKTIITWNQKVEEATLFEPSMYVFELSIFFNSFLSVGTKDDTLKPSFPSSSTPF